MARIEAAPLREITNELTSNSTVISKKTQHYNTKAPEWKGTHIKFDDDGNSNVVIHDSTPTEDEVSNNELDDNSVTISDFSEGYDEEEAIGDDIKDEDSELNDSYWNYRDPIQWSGRHIKFEIESDEETEEDNEHDDLIADDYEEDEEDTGLESIMDQLTTKDKPSP
jgi:hypothetical protein